MSATRSIFAIWLLIPATAGAAEPVAFNRDVRAILSENCLFCHGPDKNKREAGLRLDVEASATGELESKKRAIVPGKPEESELVRRIKSTDPVEQMPPPDLQKKLTPREIDILTRWIADGAKYENHWSFNPVQRPSLPPPASAYWPVRNPVDQFVQAKLSSLQRGPSPEADKRTLIRRVTLDLTGLPPTAAEIEAFLNDPSPTAFESVVDRLLASPRFAERQAMDWLDAVRYADSVGFHGDQFCDVWPYRDYVLKAFHENKPFDEFTREQLAGDLLPNATQQQKVASAFNRLNRMTAEGGAQDKEYLAKYAADRVRTVGMVWLGLTTGCAECHDHKFDPLTTKDFYRLEAFFADITEQGFYGGAGPTGEWGPLLTLTTPAQEAELAKYDRELAQIKAIRDAVPEEALSAARADWEQHILALDKSKQLAWSTVEPTSLSTKNGAVLKHTGGGLIVAEGPNPDHETYSVTFKPGAGDWTSLRLQLDSDLELPGSNVGRGWVSIVLSEIEIDVRDKAGAIWRSAPIAEAATVEPRKERNGYPAFAAVDGNAKTGWGNDRSAPTNRLVVRFRVPIVATAETELTVRLRQESEFRRATIGRFRIGMSRLEGATIDNSGVPDAVLATLRKEPEKRTDKELKAVRDFYRILGPGFDALRSREDELKARRGLLLCSIPDVLTTVARTEPREIRVLPRGNWMDQSGDIVEPNVPEFLGPLAIEGRRPTRLDLANWLVNEKNPLTSRVIANRVWKRMFGTGLSKNLDDIGSQGEWPSHPELLDWLASELMQPQWNAGGRHAWDFKHLVRTIVTSHAYRQSSVIDDETRLRDPDNRLIARQTPIRMDAEVIRDNALAIAGTLKERVGGPSVFPVQPDGYWTALNFPKREYAASLGDDLNRRSLYTHWQRTFLHPTLLVFDAATREECTVQRSISNTPLQALTVLNDVIFVEAARDFAEKTLTEGGSSTDARIAWAFHRAVGRPISEAERQALMNLHAAQRSEFEKSPAAATALIRVGEFPPAEGMDPVELAAMSVVTRAILNLHETITRD